MSMPSIVLRCEKCDDSANTFSLFRNLRYLFKNIDICISKSFGYCIDCDSLGVIENFNNIDYKLEQIQYCSEESINKARSVVSINLTPSMMQSSAAPVQELTSIAYFLAIALKRKGDERCLRCLSRNIIEFDGDMNLHYGLGGCFEGNKRTGFHHLGCGGEYIAYGSENRFFLGRKPTYFNVSESWDLSKA